MVSSMIVLLECAQARSFPFPFLFFLFSLPKHSLSSPVFSLTYSFSFWLDFVLLTELLRPYYAASLSRPSSFLLRAKGMNSLSFLGPVLYDYLL